MKNLIMLLLLFLSISCSKDDDVKEPVKELTLYTKWYYKEFVVDDVVIPYDDHEECGKDFIEFYDTNKVKSIDVFDCEEDLNWMGTFTKTDNMITLTVGNQSKTIEVIELTVDTFVYQLYEDRNNNGVDEHYIEKFTRE